MELKKDLAVQIVTDTITLEWWDHRRGGNVGLFCLLLNRVAKRYLTVRSCLAPVLFARIQNKIRQMRLRCTLSDSSIIKTRFMSLGIASLARSWT